jgi:segregation and condensation protein A
MEIASEFILVAATLMQIKAKMLLPRPELDKNGEEIDPREDLVRHLLEYKKYKALIADFALLEENRLKLEKRGNIADEIEELSKQTNVEAELQDFDLYKLLKVYIRVMDRYEIEKSKPIHTVTPYPYQMETQKEYILKKVKLGKKVSFLEILQDMPVKIAIIFNFLSILEILQHQKISIVIGEGYNNFWIKEFEEAQPITALP